MRFALPSVITAIPSTARVVRTSAFIGPPYVMSFLNGHCLPKKTTCSSSPLQPSQKAFAGPSRPQTLAVYPPAALPLPVCECSSFGKPFLLDTGESKKQGEPLPLCRSLTD